MTDLIDSGEIPTTHTITRPATSYYTISAARMRSHETVIIDSRTGRPYGIDVPDVVPLGHTDAWIGDLLQDPPTGTPPPLPPTPPTPAKAGRPRDYRPAHRRPLPLHTVAAAVVGLTLAAFAGGWMSHLLLSAAVR